ncbi:MAG TPA: glutamyl-tRNA reductase [Isosphaeraceae bacterium]|nr:glutamyl-tRNA reductase [Isosphaeraceae bacterium]
MKLLTLGVDHRSAPTAIREALAFDGHRCGDGLEALARTFPGNEFVVLSTCNRVELYAAGERDQVPEIGALTDFLAQFHTVPTDRFIAHLVDHHDGGAVSHLFRVTSSIESLVLGEGQILNQVKQAYETARQHKTIGPIFHRVFEHALHVGKKVRELTGMDQGRLSIASVAVDMARDIFSSFGDKTVLVIGAGKMADLTLQHLVALNPGQILVTNHNHDRAEVAAARWGGQAVPFDRLGLALIEADLVISTTASEQPIVGLDDYARVQRARRNRLALILDIAVPRDFDSRIGDLEQVYLYNVDDLRQQAEQNRQGREKGLGTALAIIEKETDACLATLRHQWHAGALLRQLGDSAEQTRQRELDRLFAARPDLSPADREAIIHMAFRLQNQFLHHPRAALRSAASAANSEHPHPFLSAVRHLFGLAE